MIGIKLTKFGTNMNKRYYIAVGSTPFGDWKPHPMYPWWKRWKIGFFKDYHI